MKGLWVKIPVVWRWFGAALVTFGTVWGGAAATLSEAKPIVDSGPFPLASREEVNSLGEKLAQLSKQSQQQLVTLQQNDNYLMREHAVDDYMKWQTQYVMADGALKKNPNDPVARALKDIAQRQMLRSGKALGIK